MSLKAFHIVFIVASLGLMVFLADWSGKRVMQGQDGLAHGLLYFSIAGFVLGIVYLSWFIKKYARA